MPAAPEVAEPGRPVRRVEVLGEDEPHQQGQADRHVGVAGEVAIDLGRVGVGRHQRVRRRVGLRHREDGIHDRPREEVGDHHLLDQAQGDERQARRDGNAIGVARARELRQELARPHDRPGDEVWEEAQVDGRVDRLRGRDKPPLDVDDVGDGLEREEADPDRQRDRQQGQRHPERHRVERVGDVLREERVVLEHRQRAEVEADGEGEDRLLPPLRFRAMDGDGAGLVHHGDPAEQQAEQRVGRRVEDVAGHDDERLPHRGARHQRPRQREHDREEDRELDGWKEQPRVSLLFAC